MAKISPNGMLSGVCGTVVYANWKGQPYCRSRPGPRKYKTSEKQLVQQRRFAVARKFVDSFDGLMKFSFTSNLDQKTSRNSAIGFISNHALTGDYPNFEIDYSKVLVSEGTLDGVPAPKVASTKQNLVGFSWADNSYSIKTTRTDQLILVVFCPELGYGTFLPMGAVSKSKYVEMELEEFAGLIVHTWITVKSIDGMRISNSVYTGEIRIANQDIIEPANRVNEKTKQMHDAAPNMIITATGSLHEPAVNATSCTVAWLCNPRSYLRLNYAEIGLTFTST